MLKKLFITNKVIIIYYRNGNELGDIGWYSKNFSYWFWKRNSIQNEIWRMMDRLKKDQIITKITVL